MGADGCDGCEHGSGRRGTRLKPERSRRHRAGQGIRNKCGGGVAATAPGRGVGWRAAPHRTRAAATKAQAGGARHNMRYARPRLGRSPAALHNGCYVEHAVFTPGLHPMGLAFAGCAACALNARTKRRAKHHMFSTAASDRQVIACAPPQPGAGCASFCAQRVTGVLIAICV